MINKRKNEISYLNVLLCLFVVFIHVVSPTVNVLGKNTLEYNAAMLPWRTVSFVVPGFVLLSGVKLFLTKKDEKGYLSYLKGRILGVIVPYVVAFVIYYAFFVYTFDYPLELGFVIEHLLKGTLVYHLYFIVLLFQFDLLFPLWKLIINKCSPMLVVPFTLVLTIVFEKWSSEMIRVAGLSNLGLMPDRMIMTYIGYWILGCYIGKYYDKFTELVNRNFKTICVMFGIGFLMFLNYTYIAFNGLDWVQFTNEIHTVYSITVIVFLYALFLKIKGKMPKIISLVDRASFDIYLYHVLVLYAAEYLLSKLYITNQLAAFGVRFLLGYGVTIPVCILLSVIKRKIKNR